MKVILLTTDTHHHTYFAWELAESNRLQAIFLETAHVEPPFETAHPFEALRDEYERQELLRGFSGTIADVAPTSAFPNLNAPEGLAALRQIDPEVVIVFGTGKLEPDIFAIPKIACLNLHGGHPEEYRGLDTHLWAIYHRDFANLVTTLHHMDAGLDTGDIIFQSAIPLHRGMKLHELRAANTKVCVDLVITAIEALERMGHLPARKQLKRGRYYSFMPSALKEIAVRNFERHVANL